MLSRILTLVACVPLLLPPGYCVCVARHAVAAPASPTRSEARLAPTHSHKAGGCSHGHAVRGVATDAPGGEAPPAPVSPTDPDPVCPAASHAVDRIPPGESLPDVSVHLFPATYVVAEPVVVHDTPRPPERLLSCRPASPPLYLAHCSLVI